MSNTELVGRARVADDHNALTRLEHLLLRYPQLDTAERQEAGILLRDTPPLDLGLLSINTAAWTKAEQFRSDNPEFFRSSWKLKLLWVILALIAVGTVILLWNAGLK